MNTERNTSMTLKYSVIIGMAIVIIGVIVYMMDMGDIIPVRHDSGTWR